MEICDCGYLMSLVDYIEDETHIRKEFYCFKCKSSKVEVKEKTEE